MRRDDSSRAIEVNRSYLRSTRGDLIGRGGSPNRPRSTRAFALYEVLIGLMIFVIGVVALGHAIENCLNASVLSEEDNRIRQILSNRMAEIQATPGVPDPAKETKIDSGYGAVQLLQKTQLMDLREEDGALLDKIHDVTLTAKWKRGGVEQSRQIEFYVYRSG